MKISQSLQRFVLSILFGGGILWLFNTLLVYGIKEGNIAAAVVGGALIPAFTLIIQFYFRKAGTEEKVTAYPIPSVPSTSSLTASKEVVAVPPLPVVTELKPTEEKVEEVKTEAKVEEKVKPKDYSLMTPEEVERDFIYGEFEDRIKQADLALDRMVKEIHERPELAQPYQEFIEYFRELKANSEHSIKVNKALVDALKAGKVEPWALGEAGYYILGKKPPWK